MGLGDGVMQVNVEDYLTREQVEEILHAEFRGVAVDYFSVHAERLLANAAYEAVREVVDTVVDANFPMVVKIRKKVEQVIEELSSYSVFFRADRHDRARGVEDSLGAQYLDMALEESESLIRYRVTEIVKRMGFDDVQELVVEAVGNMFRDNRDE